MEAVPRLPMLSFEIRQPDEPVDFSRKLKQHIKNHYNENPELFADDIKQLEGLRSSATHPTRDISGCLTMKKYYCQLHFLSGRFPMSKDGAAAVKFSWKLFSNNGSTSMSDIAFELSVILYNIGALHSQLGAEDSRTTSEGMKMSCTHFQCAAWAFQHIGQEYASTSGLDVPLDIFNFMRNVCLGQAQECILEKSMMDNRKASIIAKVTVQTIEYYKQAAKALADDIDDFVISDTVGLRLVRKWEKYLNFKIYYLGCIACLYQGQQAEEQQKMGERVAFYQAAFNKLEEARRLSRNLENFELVNEAVTFVHDVVEGKRKAAKNENEFIYHEEVPDLSSLPTIKGASLVKGIPFSINDPELSGPDIFARIVPMKAHESSSLYSEEKAKLLRRIVGMIESKDEELEKFLSTLQLDDLNQTETNELPQDLIDKCASFNARSKPVVNLRDTMSKLTQTYREVDNMLQEIKTKLEEEEMRERKYQEAVGKRPPTIAATDLTREAKKYQEAQAKGAESNVTLNRALIIHLPYLRLLSEPLKVVAKELPTVIETPEGESVANEMRILVNKVNEMKKQRIMLKEKLRDSICQDDILKKLVTFQGDNVQALFDSELQKHQSLVSIIEQNLMAQDNIIKAMKETYARYGTTRKYTAITLRKRKSVINSMIAAYESYDDLMNMSTKGYEFYKKLHVNVSKLLQRIKGTCMVQEEERQQMVRTARVYDGRDIPLIPGVEVQDYVEDENAMPANLYLRQFEDIRNRATIPGVRPAPLGSEESTANKLDNIPAFYQGKDQTWVASPNSSNGDNSTKNYVSQSPAVAGGKYPPESPSQSLPQDIYPISAYSSVMPNATTTGYAGPKSNYYNTENSPSRYINPPHFYADQNQPVVTTYGTAQAPTNSSYSHQSQKTVTEVAPTPSTYGAVGYSYPSQPGSSGYTSTTYSALQPSASTVSFGNTSQGGNYQYCGTLNDNKNPAQNTQASFSSYEAEAVDPFSVSQQAYTQYTSNYNLASTSKLPSYAMGLKYDNAAQHQASNAQYSGQQYITSQTYPAHSATGAYAFPSNQQLPNYYVQGSSSGADVAKNYATADMSVMHGVYHPYAAANFIAQQIQAGIVQPSYDANWQQVYTPNVDASAPLPTNPSQSLKSGNESLYTACQTNNYSLTSSEVYKNVDCQNQAACTEQYYVNQYGSSGSQNQHGLNYGNSATYMQAGTDKQQATTTTTYSRRDSKSSPLSEHSNVDLLAGLDFDVGQSPLVPETSPKADDSGVNARTKAVSQEEEENKLVQKTSRLTIRRRSPTAKESSIDLEKLVQEVEKYEKFVISLTLKTLNGPTCLDIKWKELCDLQEKSSHLHIISVARCYPMKNRYPDILPYDDSRIELPSTKDDYINASLVKSLSSNCPNFILTQAPLPSTYADFWAMVFEQQVEVIVCLLNNAELDEQFYFPKEKGQELDMGKLKISLQSSNPKSHWVERIISVSVAETRVTRVVIHVQFTSWPGSSFPESPGPFLMYASECINFFNQQRSFSHPVVVHCTSGVGRSGLFCLIVSAVQDIQSGKGIPDLVAIAGQMSQYRKSPLRDREHLKFAYQAVLHYCQGLLSKRKLSLENKIEEEAAAERSEGASAEPDSTTDSCTSSGRTTPSSLPPDVLSTLDPAMFHITVESSKKGKRSAKKRYSTESFARKSDTSFEGFSTNSEDPLSRLDPLWTMKK